ncbi:hypothetical protein LCGC14_1152290 [marine sediment metagenome]|uniref:phosphoribosylglycinamide formyltransferase 1 n=1 Tax=marine sediment metagenome TaxID=412755 RepID=A0A0F9M004_9ZZZZ
MKIAVLASGSGSNLKALIDSIKDGSLPAEIALVISNNPEAFALERAKREGIESRVVRESDFDSRENYDEELIKIIKDYNVELVVLAGYMLICSKPLVEEFYGKLINLHPSMLPEFPGADAIGDALRSGAKITGVTVHFVDEGCDSGPIIFQEEVVIKEDDTEETLAERIHTVEHKILPKAVKYYAQGRLHLEDRNVSVG